MNKIYRVIWSKVRNCYVVVSEFAKRLRGFFVKAWKIEYRKEITLDDKFLYNLREKILRVVQSD